MPKKIRPRICLVMIVRNESHVICKVLQHLLPYINYWVISDTGSTDDTKQKITTFFKKVEVPGNLVEHEWLDFGHNRSRAFDAAHQLRDVHKCDYYMVFDADDYINGTIPLPSDMNKDAYYCRFGKDESYDRLLFFRCDQEWGYKCVLHEFPYCKTKPDFSQESLSCSSYYIESGRSGARNNDPNKYVKDATIIVAALQKETDPEIKARYMFYAAQSFKDACMFIEAIRFYRMYLDNPVCWVEQRYESYMCIGICMLSLPDIYSERDVRDAFLSASAEDPERAEPFYYIAKMYREKNKMKDAYIFSKIGSKIPYPEGRLLFVDKTIYSYKIDDELAVAAYWTDRKHECKRICTKILKLKNLPDDFRERVWKNLSFCD